MKTIRVPVLVLIILGLLVLFSLGYGYTQQMRVGVVEAEMLEAENRAKLSAQEALMQRNISIAAQREAESQRQLAETHRIELERALAACKGK